MGATVARVQIDSEIRKLIKIAEDQGWSVTTSKGGRLNWNDPDGVRRASSATRVAANRNFQNLVAELRRNGLDIPRDEAKEKAVIVPQPAEVELEVEVSPEEALEVLMEFVTAEREPPELIAVQRRLDEANMEVADLTTQKKRLENQVSSLQIQVATQASTLHAITDAFEKPPWEILTRIAEIVGVKVGS